jgi:hypothetical protein
VNEFKDLTKEQKKKIKDLQTKYAFHAVLRGCKFALTLFLADFVISLVNVSFVQNEGFLYLAGMASFIMIFYGLIKQNAKEHDKIKEEVAKILES